MIEIKLDRRRGYTKMHLPRNIHQNYIQQQEAVATINRQGSLYALVMINTIISMNLYYATGFEHHNNKQDKRSIF